MDVERLDIFDFKVSITNDEFHKLDDIADDKGVDLEKVIERILVIEMDRIYYGIDRK